jgi:hypothetical protein
VKPLTPRRGRYSAKAPGKKEAHSGRAAALYTIVLTLSKGIPHCPSQTPHVLCPSLAASSGGTAMGIITLLVIVILVIVIVRLL